MSDKLGPLAYGAKAEEIFLGREITRSRNFSEDTAILIDAEVKKLVTGCMKRADKILRDNMSVLHRLSNALLEREILDSDEIDRIMRNEELAPVERREIPQTATAPAAATERPTAASQVPGGGASRVKKEA